MARARAHARARGPLPFKLRRPLTPVSSSFRPRPFADWPPVPSFRGSFQPPSSRFECLSTNPFTRPGSHPDIYPRVRLPPPSPDKVKSYGSVKAILFLPPSIYLSLSQCSLFHATTACFSGFSWTRRTAQRREHAKA